eukprot:COSAG05_NODE_1973_length_3765_cov_7114.990998_1_plen_48_part_10
MPYLNIYLWYIDMIAHTHTGGGGGGGGGREKKKKKKERRGGFGFKNYK